MGSTRSAFSPNITAMLLQALHCVWPRAPETRKDARELCTSRALLLFVLRGVTRISRTRHFLFCNRLLIGGYHGTLLGPVRPLAINCVPGRSVPGWHLPCHPQTDRQTRESCWSGEPLPGMTPRHLFQEKSRSSSQSACPVCSS